MAEWLRRGLQILAPRFDSGRGLQIDIAGGDSCRLLYFTPIIKAANCSPVVSAKMVLQHGERLDGRY